MTVIRKNYWTTPPFRAIFFSLTMSTFADDDSVKNWLRDHENSEAEELIRKSRKSDLVELPL
jgi:hypothetical protein